MDAKLSLKEKMEIGRKIYESLHVPANELETVLRTAVTCYAWMEFNKEKLKPLFMMYKLSGGDANFTAFNTMFFHSVVEDKDHATFGLSDPADIDLDALLAAEEKGEDFLEVLSKGKDEGNTGVMIAKVTISAKVKKGKKAKKDKKDKASKPKAG